MVAFQIFWWDIYWYGIFYFISFVLGYLCVFWIGKKQYFKKFPQLQLALTSNLDMLLIFVLLWVLVGGRLGHIFIYDFSHFIGHWWEIFAVWNGGMSFIGGIIGVVIAVLCYKFIYALQWKEFVLLFDIILVLVPFGIFLGRFGNYLNQELFGIIFTNSLWFSESMIAIFQKLNFLHVYPKVDSFLRINTNQLSMCLEGGLLFLVNGILFRKQIRKKVISIGKISGWFLLLYSIIRFFLEYLRNDSQTEFIGIFTKSQWFFVFAFAISLWFLIYFAPKHEENL